MGRRLTAALSPFTLLLLLGFAAASPEDGCDTTPDDTPPPVAPGAGLIINEVMWNPDQGPEWVEIVNNSDETMSLTDVILTDNEGTDTNEGIYRFASGSTLAPGALLAIGAEAWGGVDLVWSGGGPQLANGGDDLHLVFDPDGDGLFDGDDILDAMLMFGAMGANGNGSSLIRTCLSCDGNEVSSWDESEQWGGTPGASNDSPPFVTPAPTPTPPVASGRRVLFDAGNCQRCGNADWVITGGYSDFAQALRDAGFEVGSTTLDLVDNTLDIWDVLVIPEPQYSFTSAEHAAMEAFLARGGGIMMIANHIGADRNFSDWDAVEIFNGYKQGAQTSSNDWLYNTAGIRFREKQYSEDPLTDVRSHPAVNGVNSVGLYAGTTVDIFDSSRATALIYPERTDSWGPMVVASEPAMGGRVLAVGDSSPFSDGSCACGDDLTNNFAVYNHEELAVSGVLWLAGVQ